MLVKNSKIRFYAVATLVPGLQLTVRSASLLIYATDSLRLCDWSKCCTTLALSLADVVRILLLSINMCAVYAIAVVNFCRPIKILYQSTVYKWLCFLLI